jgi:pSer/pThr/pTyr-binding forkhead associated (FHA) protein
LRDLASKNGTFHGEDRVRDDVPLADGDEIRIGTVRLQFRAARNESTATASTGGRA